MLELPKHMGRCKKRPGYHHAEKIVVSAPYGAAPFLGDAAVPAGAADRVGEFSPDSAPVGGKGSTKGGPRHAGREPTALEATSAMHSALGHTAGAGAPHKGEPKRLHKGPAKPHAAPSGGGAGAGAPHKAGPKRIRKGPAKPHAAASGGGAGAAAAADGRIPCPTCGRKFAIDNLGRHQAICRNLKHRIPQVFDSSTQRAGISGETYMPVRPVDSAPPSKRTGVLKPGAKYTPSKKGAKPVGKAAKWKEQSGALRQAMLAARRTAASHSDMSRTAGSLGRSMVAGLGTPSSPEAGMESTMESTAGSAAMGSTMNSTTMGSTRRVGFADTIKNAVMASRAATGADARTGASAGAGSGAGAGAHSGTAGPGGKLTLAGTVRSLMASKRWTNASSKLPSRPATASASTAPGGDSSSAFGRRVAYASDYQLSHSTTAAAKAERSRRTAPSKGGSRPVSRGAARRHFKSTHKDAFKRPTTSHRVTKPSGRFNETPKTRDGRVHSKVNHFEAGADNYTYGGWEPDKPAKFGSSAERFVDTTRVHAGLYDGLSATELAQGIKPGRLVHSYATSAANPLATSTLQVAPHAPVDSSWRARPRTALTATNASSADNPLVSSTYQVAAHPSMPGRRR